jgi:hypothetical protein
MRDEKQQKHGGKGLIEGSSQKEVLCGLRELILPLWASSLKLEALADDLC